MDQRGSGRHRHPRTSGGGPPASWPAGRSSGGHNSLPLKSLNDFIAPSINQTKIDKVFVKGKMASLIFKDISKVKKGRILSNKSQIIEFIRKDLNNNDYLMIKASLATGLNKIVKNLKGLN